MSMLICSKNMFPRVSHVLLAQTLVRNHLDRAQVSSCPKDGSAADRALRSILLTVFIVNQVLNRDYNPLFSCVTHLPPVEEERVQQRPFGKKDACYR